MATCASIAVGPGSKEVDVYDMDHSYVQGALTGQFSQVHCAQMAVKLEHTAKRDLRCSERDSLLTIWFRFCWD